MKSTARRRAPLLCALVVVSLTQGCGESREVNDPSTGAASIATDACVDPSVFNLVEYDYPEPVEPDPASFVANQNIPQVISGEVEGVVEGPRVSAVAEKGTPQEELFVAVKIAVDEHLGGTEKGAAGESAYVIFERGPYDADTGAPYPLDEWQRAVPPGTPVVAFLTQPRRDLIEGFTEEWAEAPIFAPVRKGLVLESCGEIVNPIAGATGRGWQFRSLAELESELAN